jgi:transcriptional regulator with GAF, ATPase, and Fis domain
MKLETLQAVALAAAEERTIERVLERIARGLAEQPGVALVRVWLTGPGDICPACPMRPECPDQTRCLHLVASAGRSVAEPGEDWARTDGVFRRFPLGVRKIGRIGATGDAVRVADVTRAGEWIARPAWAAAEAIQSFAGQPLAFRGEVLGALAVFSRTPLGDAEFAWLRIFADHAAAAIANSRALDEIARLREQLELENAYLRDEVKSVLHFGEIIGRSGALQKALHQVELVAPTDAGVLVTGESGTGKELFARAIHERSGRHARPLITVNCAAIPRDLFESEFFGHVKGAFTGALRDRVGRFQLADHGTIFLDEVGETPLEVQPKLLRILQDGQFEPVGDDRTRRVDVRVIAATNRDLRAEVEAGRFRRDLYYRLSVFPIEVPPLRDRVGDVARLAAHFAARAARRLGLPEPRLLASEVRRLENYDWPGNVRELEHIVERAVIVSRAAPLRFDLGPDARGGRRRAGREAAEAPDVAILTEAELRQRTRQNLEAALRQCRGRIRGPGGAAELLGMKPTTLASRLRALGMTGPPLARGGEP